MEETIRELKVSWSSEAEIQYYDILLFWIERTKSEKYSEQIESEVTKIIQTLKDFPRIWGNISEKRGEESNYIISFFCFL